MEDPGEMCSAFIDYFKHIFSSLNLEEMPEELELTREPVTEKENEDIFKPPSLDEIKKVIFLCNHKKLQVQMVF